MMNETHLREKQLRQLLNHSEGENPDQNLLDHIDHCRHCQERLENLAADASWWSLTKECFDSDENSTSSHSDQNSNAPIDAFSYFESQSTPSSQSQEPDGDQKKFQPTNNLETLGRMDEFEVEKRIGQGGMGIVYRGFDYSLNRPVAIKIMLDHLSENEEARNRFQREAQAAAAVVHPNIIPIHKVSSNLQNPYIAMAFVDGDSLQQWVDKNGPCEVIDVVRISLQITSALAAAHRVGLIHRDIKPANVLMEKDVSRVVLTDFGLAKAVDDVVMTQSGTLAGTPAYMSPEHIKSKNLDPRSDLFSLGGLMYFLCTGKEPYSGSNAFAVINQIMRNSVTPVSELNPKVPPVLARIIDRLLEKNPDDRFQTAEELEAILESLLAHLHRPDHYNIPSIGILPSVKRRIWRIGAITTGLILLIGLGFSANYLSGLFPTSPKEEHRSIGENHQKGTENGTNGEGSREGERAKSSEGRSHDRSSDRHREAGGSEGGEEREGRKKDRDSERTERSNKAREKGERHQERIPSEHSIDSEETRHLYSILENFGDEYHQFESEGHR